ncbi:MAG: DUF4093 domain-containing protein [Oscillospiraceae bacterium]|nr:DUF4093 domain-containing protein [Oscillospiraceae bacterium]
MSGQKPAGERLTIKEVLIVEGKYDKARLAQLADAVILTTDGFGVFNDAEKRAVIKRLAEKRGVIILTDSDGAGFLIRNRLKGMLPPQNVKHAYIPEIYGKERRKAAPSKAGTLGVEGMSREVLERCLKQANATLSGGSGPEPPLTKPDLYELGLSGGVNSSHKREKLLSALNLPRHLSINALLPVINALYTKAEIIQTIESL